MTPRFLKRAGAILFAVTMLTFIGLAYWLDTVVPYWLPSLSNWHHPRLFFRLFLFLPLIVLMVLWVCFLIVSWLASRRLMLQDLRQSTDHSAKARRRLMLVAVAITFATTVLVELAYPSWMAAVGLGYLLNQDVSSTSFYYFFAELPQLFLVLLWTAFLLAAWLTRPNSSASHWRFLWLIGLLPPAITALVWAGYPFWRAGTAMVTAIPDGELPTAALQTLKVLPALFVACLWLGFSGYFGSYFRSRQRR